MRIEFDGEDLCMYETSTIYEFKIGELRVEKGGDEIILTPSKNYSPILKRINGKVCVIMNIISD